MKRIAALLLAVLTLTACSPKAPADAGNTPGTAVTPAAEEVSAEATTIRLEKVEGSAELTNDAGKTLTIIDKMPLFNGYGVSTQDESFAYLSLDAAKAAKLDSVSSAEVAQNGKAYELTLKSGNVFFNVTKPLAEDETLNIRTSTIAVGIRGTSGVVSADRDTAVYILDGSAELTANGESFTVAAGEKAVIAGGEVVISPLTESEIDAFAAEEIRGDTALQDRISESSGLDIDALLNPPDPDDYDLMPLSRELLFRFTKESMTNMFSEDAGRNWFDTSDAGWGFYVCFRRYEPGVPEESGHTPEWGFGINFVTYVPTWDNMRDPYTLPLVSDVIFVLAGSPVPSDAEIYALVDSITITDEERRLFTEAHRERYSDIEIPPANAATDVLSQSRELLFRNTKANIEHILTEAFFIEGVKDGIYTGTIFAYFRNEPLGAIYPLPWKFDIQLFPEEPYTGYDDGGDSISDIISFAALPSDAEIYAFVDSIQITDEQRRIYAEQHGLQGYGAAAASSSPASGLRQGEYIWETSDKMRYKFTLLDGVPQPMGTSVQETYNGTVTETIMAYASSRSSADDEWGEWRVAPHYWAGLQCSDCEELNADGVIPESYMLGFSHAWSGEWKNSPPVYKY